MVVLIATNGRCNLLERTLTSMSLCRRTNTLMEVIIIENGAKTETEKLVKSYQSSLPIRYEYVPQANKSNALNHALTKLSNCLVFFTDDDVRFHPNTLIAYEEASNGKDHGTFFGGPVGVDYESEPPEWLTPYLPYSVKGWQLDEHMNFLLPTEQARFLGCNWAAFADDIKKVGYFNIKLGRSYKSRGFGEETDLQNHLVRAGINRRYLSNAMVWHYVPKNNCSPIWALNRAYKHGLSAGLMAEPQILNLFGYPKWMIRTFIEEKFLNLLKMMFSADPHKSYGATRDLLFYWGFVRGVKEISSNATRS